MRSHLPSSKSPARRIRGGCRRVKWISSAQAQVDGPWRSVLGPESRLPNVYWGAMSPASLRRMSYFTALPPVEKVFLQGEATYRYVRQDTTLWSALHTGRLTTSRLKDALGLRDRTASRIVGGPQYPELGVLKAYNHLLQPLFVPVAAGAAAGAAVPAAGAPSPRCSETDALQLNEAARLQFNEEVRAAAAVATASATATATRGGGYAAAGRRPQTARDGGGKRGIRQRDSVGRNTSAIDTDHDNEGWSRTDRRRVSELAALAAVGASGAVQLRLLWGNLQEAAAVATLSFLFPTSQLEEVGLLCLPDPRVWGLEPEELPALGASPDALITHHVPLTQGDLRVARAELQAAAAAAAAAVAVAAAPRVVLGSAGGGVGGGEGPSSDLRDAAHHVARSVLRSALVRHTQWPPPPPLSGASWQRWESLGTRTGGSSLVNDDGAGGSPSYFKSRSPPLFESGWGAAMEWLTAELLRQRQPAAGAAAADVPTLSAHPNGSGGGGEGEAAEEVVAVVQLREVVEVKNHCPFVNKGQRKARKRGLVLDYVVREHGPIESVWPLWVPQLQAHMACAGVDSALLLSRSASKGVRLFRVFRDDKYLAAAFDILRELQASYVARGQPPGVDPWVGRTSFEEFIQHTAAIAHSAETVVRTPKTPQLPDTDPSAFWDLRA